MARVTLPAGMGDTRINYNEKMDVFSYDADSGESQISTLVREHLQALDRDGKGYITSADLKQAQEAVSAQENKSTFKGSGDGSTSQELGGMSVRASIMRGLGLRGNRITKHDMAAISDKTVALQEEKQFYRRLVLGIVAALVILTAAMFAVSFAAAELAKETHVDGDGVVRTGSGATALMGSADMLVKDGRLVGRSQPTCTNETCADPAIATRAAEEHRPLNSKYADEVFESLDRFTMGFTGVDGYTTRMTMRVHGFMRIRNALSVHGTVVKLEVLRGTITLDDTDIHLSPELVLYLEGQGLMTSEQDASAFGRRLQTSLATVLGIFGFFDESTFPDLPADQDPPRSLTPPYIAVMVDRWPCKSETACLSSLLPGQHLPGYDEATDSILSRYTALVTETATYTVSNYPNHPMQELIMVSDHTTKAAVAWQSYGGDFKLCYNATYEPPASMDDDGWYMSYLGEVQREAVAMSLLGEEYLVPASTNRLFRLQSKNVSADEAWYEYEDDVTTLSPKRMGMPFAREQDLIIEETFVLESWEISEELADYLMANWSIEFGIISSDIDWQTAVMNCTKEMNADAFDVPNILSPLVEAFDSVKYYVQELRNEPSSGAKNMLYWQYAEAYINGPFVEAFQGNATSVPWINTTLPAEPDDVESSNESRRLTASFGAQNYDFNLPISDYVPGFPDMSWSLAHDPTDASLNCVSLTVSADGNSDWNSRGQKWGWGASGTLSWGRYCAAAVDLRFTVDGEARIWWSFSQRWGWNVWRRRFIGVTVKFEVGAAFAIHHYEQTFTVTQYGTHNPSCPSGTWNARRLESPDEEEPDTKLGLEGDDSDYIEEEEEVATSLENSRRLPPNVPWPPNSPPGGARRRSNRRRYSPPSWARRRAPTTSWRSTQCRMDVMRFDMTIYATGSVDLFGLWGASIQGHLRFRVGPMAVGQDRKEYLDRGVDSRIIIDGEFRVCASFRIFRLCWHIRKDLANVNIGN